MGRKIWELDGATCKKWDIWRILRLGRSKPGMGRRNLQEVEYTENSEVGTENLQEVRYMKNPEVGTGKSETGLRTSKKVGYMKNPEVGTGKSEIGRRNLWLRKRNIRMGGESELEVEKPEGPGDRLRMSSWYPRLQFSSAWWTKSKIHWT